MSHGIIWPTEGDTPSVPDTLPLPTLPTLEIPKVELPAMPSIASGAFTGGPKDELASVDVYKIKSALGKAVKPITSVQELSAEVDKWAFDLTLDAGTANDFMSKVKGELTFDKDVLTKRLLGCNSEFKSAFNELNDKLKNGAMLSTLKDKAKSVMCTINDTKSLVNSAKIGDVQALGKFINKYTGTPIFSGQDKGALSGLLGSVVKTSSDLGITGAFKAITDTVKDNGIIGRVTRAVLPAVVKNSDTGLLKELTSGKAGMLINVVSPGFTQTFSRAFKYQGNRATSLNSFEDIFGAFKNIDNSWDQLSRGGEGNTAVNLLSIMGGSKDFQNLMMTGVKYWSVEQKKQDGRRPAVPIDPMYMLVSAYQEVTVGQAVQRDFPKVALLSLYNQRLPKRNGLAGGTRNANNNSFLNPTLVSGAMGALFGR